MNTAAVGELTAPEQRLCQTIATGTLLDLQVDDPGHDDPARGATWDASRTVRAELLVELLTETRKPTGAPSARALKLRGARITGTLDLEATVLVCPLLLQGCWLEHPISLLEARAPVVRLPGCHLPGLAADQLETRGNLELNRGFTAQGEVSLLGAHIGGQLNLNGASLTNPDGLALSAGGLTVDQSMFCRDGFTAQGEIRLPGAHIGGQLSFNGASLTNPSGRVLYLESVAAADLLLMPRQPPVGIVDLTSARIGRLRDPARWPTVLRTRGLVYEALEPAMPFRDRLRWLKQDPGGYLPQSYDQLAAAYRRAGDIEAARRVAIAKQWGRRRVLNPLGRLWNWLLYLTIGYGYRTWQAGVWLLGLLVVGTRVFDHAYPAHIVATKQPAPAFHAAAYTLDVLLPIVDLGQQSAWQPRGAALRWSWVLIGAGWVLTTAVVAGLTGLFKRD
jgi:hypothetical protein